MEGSVERRIAEGTFCFLSLPLTACLLVAVFHAGLMFSLMLSWWCYAEIAGLMKEALPVDLDMCKTALLVLAIKCDLLSTET